MQMDRHGWQSQPRDDRTKGDAVEVGIEQLAVERLDPKTLVLARV
jgi:hypothetical protein